MSRTLSFPRPAAAPARVRPQADCQPSADASCGHCADCREAEARRFDGALWDSLESIRRSERVLAGRT